MKSIHFLKNFQKPKMFPLYEHKINNYIKNSFSYYIFVLSILISKKGDIIMIKILSYHFFNLNIQIMFFIIINIIYNKIKD